MCKYINQLDCHSNQVSERERNRDREEERERGVHFAGRERYGEGKHRWSVERSGRLTTGSNLLVLHLSTLNKNKVSTLF